MAVTGDAARVAVIGGGAWGTALAAAARRGGCAVTIWAREPEVVAAINQDHVNAPFLPRVALDPTIRATGALADAVAGAEAVLLVMPAQFMAAVTASLADLVGAATPLVICAKGIARDRFRLMTEVCAETLPGRPLAVLSGPTFADEVARGLPAAATLAVAAPTLGPRLIAALGSRTFRPYLSDDLIGAQIGGAIKNVLALACGIVMGRGLGDSARAGLITRGLAEATRLGVEMGARAATFMGLSGLGDLTLTCTSLKSRNTSLGDALGRGRSLDEVLQTRRSVAEGMFTAGAAVALGRRHGVDLPICAAVDAILSDGAEIDATIEALLSRPFRDETPGADA